MTRVFCDLCGSEIQSKFIGLGFDKPQKYDLMGINDTCPRCTALVENLNVRQILINEIVKVVAGEHNEELYRKSNILCDECDSTGSVHHVRQCAEDDPTGAYMCGKGHTVEFVPVLRPNSSVESEHRVSFSLSVAFELLHYNERL